MATIDARIANAKTEITSLIARVKGGEVLSRDEAIALMECRKLVDELKQVDTYKEVLRGTPLKALTDKWI